MMSEQSSEPKLHPSNVPGYAPECLLGGATGDTPSVGALLLRLGLLSEHLESPQDHFAPLVKSASTVLSRRMSVSVRITTIRDNDPIVKVKPLRIKRRSAICCCARLAPPMDWIKDRSVSSEVWQIK